ncbi:MAG TPA: hypothetical protein VH042_07570 [Solirubrobacterales bacterium]|jgi:hypothetical protein|nr:hypothetical protein [Solirubrobacterales bacterium]
MQALNDDQQMAAIEAKVDKLEEKIDSGFAEMRADSAAVRAQIVSTERALRTEIVAVRSDAREENLTARSEAREANLTARSEARADFRTLLTVLVSLWAATVLTVLAAHL